MREGYKESPVGVIPEDWEVSTLNDVVDPHIKNSFTGGPFGSDLKSEHYTSSGIRIIQLQNIGDGVFQDKYKIYTSQEKADQLYSCNIFPGEIIIAKMAEPLARACLVPSVDERYLMCSDGIRVKVNEVLFDRDFVLSFINSPIFRKQAEDKGTGTTRLRIGLSELKKCNLPFPPLPEQKKISAILTTMDEKITAIGEEITAAEELKKGLMQKLFSEGIGHSEFKESPLGRIPKAWECVELDEISDITRLAGYEYSKYWEETEDGEIIALRGYNISKNALSLENVSRISETLSQRLIRSRLYRGDIVFPCVGTIGKAAVITEDDKYHINQNIAKITPMENLASNYLCQYLISELCKKEITRFNATTSQPNVLVGSLRQFRLPLPSLSEQKEIAAILTTADKKITILKEKKAAYEELKKGLMQKLLTGEIRVSVEEGEKHE